MQSKIEHEKKACLDIDRFWTNVQWVTKWVLVGPNGSQWVPVGPNGSQWIPMGPNGSQWVPTNTISSKTLFLFIDVNI